METIKKPWGKEEVLEINNQYMMKKLTMLNGHRCSLQLHKKKLETIYVLNGHLRIISGATEESLEMKTYGPGEHVTVTPGLMHRMEAVNECVYLEASTPEMDDVVRLSDDYMREVL